MGLEIGIGDWEFGLGVWMNWELGFGISIEDFDWGMEIWIVIRD